MRDLGMPVVVAGVFYGALAVLNEVTGGYHKDADFVGSLITISIGITICVVNRVRQRKISRTPEAMAPSRR